MIYMYAYYQNIFSKCNKKRKNFEKKEFEVQYNDSIKKGTKYSTSVKHWYLMWKNCCTISRYRNTLNVYEETF